MGIAAIIAWITSPAGMATMASITSAGWCLSEILARIPSIKANSTFQLIQGVLGWASKLIKSGANPSGPAVPPAPPAPPAA